MFGTIFIKYLYSFKKIESNFKLLKNYVALF